MLKAKTLEFIPSYQQKNITITKQNVEIRDEKHFFLGAVFVPVDKLPIYIKELEEALQQLIKNENL